MTAQHGNFDFSTVLLFIGLKVNKKDEISVVLSCAGRKANGLDNNFLTFADSC